VESFSRGPFQSTRLIGAPPVTQHLVSPEESCSVAPSRRGPRPTAERAKRGWLDIAHQGAKMRLCLLLTTAPRRWTRLKASAALASAGSFLGTVPADALDAVGYLDRIERALLVRVACTDGGAATGHRACCEGVLRPYRFLGHMASSLRLHAARSVGLASRNNFQKDPSIPRRVRRTSGRVRLPVDQARPRSRMVRTARPRPEVDL
jgi:hypothetical protein